VLMRIPQSSSGKLTWTPTLRDSSIRAKRSVRMGVRIDLRIDLAD
jgi:hypothetical protein